MSLRKSAPSGSPYQFRCSSRALAVASCCAASIASPHRFPRTWFAVANHDEHLTESGRPRGPPSFLRDTGGDPVLWSAAPTGVIRRLLFARGLSSVGRALSLHGRCQGFDSPRLHSLLPL